MSRPYRLAHRPDPDVPVYAVRPEPPFPLGLHRTDVLEDLDAGWLAPLATPARPTHKETRP